MNECRTVGCKRMYVEKLGALRKSLYLVESRSNYLRRKNTHIHQRWARATFFWVRNRNSATCRKHLRNRNSATFQRMSLRNRNSAIPQSQFFWNPQLQVRNLRALLPQFSADFWHGVAWNYLFFYRQVFFAIERMLKGQWHENFRFGKNRRAKISCYCPFKTSFCFL